MEDRLRRLADYDALTGIRNRRQFERDLAFQIGTCQRYGDQAALLMVDLDEFKRVNDTYGHQVGDEVLKAVAGAIKKRLRGPDTVARRGGDEFAVLLPHVSAEKAASVADDLKRCIAAVTIRVPGASVTPTASVGVAYIDQHVVSNEAVLHEADRAMYAMKRAGERFGPLGVADRSSTLPKAG
jgi:diguanylate cyclase (GGDEF)-like protein